MTTRGYKDFKFTEEQEKWLSALESGEYNQGVGALRTEKGYCCLGVACDVVGLGKWTTELSESGDSASLYHFKGDDGIYDDEELPESVTDALRMHSRSGFFNFKEIPNDPLGAEILRHSETGSTFGGKQSSLMRLNDVEMSFKEIAGLIRRNPEVFFIPQDDLNARGIDNDAD